MGEEKLNYNIPEPEGFRDLSGEQQDNIIRKVKDLERELERSGIEKDAFPGKTKGEHQATYTEAERHKMASFGKYLLRDIPLFKYELWIYMFSAFGVMFTFMLETYGIFPGLFTKVLMVGIMMPLVLWFVKWFFYMPSKKRLPWIHCHGSRVISFRTADPSKGYIEIGSDERKKKIYLTKLNRHIEESTGLPCIITTEFQGENIGLLKDDKPDMRSAEFNAILEMNTAVTTKAVMKRMLRFAPQSMTSPLMVLGVINLLVLIALVLLQLGIAG